MRLLLGDAMACTKLTSTLPFPTSVSTILTSECVLKYMASLRACTHPVNVRTGPSIRSAHQHMQRPPDAAVSQSSPGFHGWVHLCILQRWVVVSRFVERERERETGRCSPLVVDRVPEPWH